MISTTSELILLIDRIAEGDRKAFSEVYDATSAKLYGIILRILKNRERADDILQEVYIKLWQRADKYNPQKATPMTWLCTIARNSAIDEFRRVEPAIIQTDYADLASESQASPQHSAQTNEALHKLNECLQQLEQAQRNVIEQAYLAGYTRSELARINKKPVGTIKSWLRRSLIQLRDCLNHD